MLTSNISVNKAVTESGGINSRFVEYTPKTRGARSATYPHRASRTLEVLAWQLVYCRVSSQEEWKDIVTARWVGLLQCKVQLYGDIIAQRCHDDGM